MKIQVFRSFGHIIRAERKRLRLSQADAARLLGVSKTTQVAYESEITQPNLAYLVRAAAMGMDVVEMVTGTPTAILAADSFDWELMEKIMAAIEDWAKQRSVLTTLQTKLNLLKVLYQHFSRTGKVDETFLGDTLRLAS